MDIKYGGIKQRKIFPYSNKNITTQTTFDLVKKNKMNGLIIFGDILSIFGNIGLLVYFVVVKYKIYKNITENPNNLSNEEIIDITILNLEKSITIYSLMAFWYFIQLVLTIYKNYNNKLDLENSKIYWFHLIFLGISFLYSLSLMVVDTQYLRIFEDVKKETHKKIPHFGKNYYIFLLIIAIFSVIFSCIGLYHDILMFHNEK